MDIFYTIMGYVAITLTICSYLYLIYYFISEEVYKNITLFDVIVLLSGPIGFLIIYISTFMTYDDFDENLD
jgi:uncharacterized protein with PQ loop repeat